MGSSLLLRSHRLAPQTTMSFAPVVRPWSLCTIMGCGRKDVDHGLVTIWTWSQFRWPELNVRSVEPTLIGTAVLWPLARDASDGLLLVESDQLEMGHTLRR